MINLVRRKYCKINWPIFSGINRIIRNLSTIEVKTVGLPHIHLLFSWTLHFNVRTQNILRLSLSYVHIGSLFLVIVDRHVYGQEQTNQSS